MKIVTLNTWGGRIYGQLMQFLRDTDADVYCLQEVFSAPEGTPSPLIFRQGHNLEGSLPAYPRLFTKIKEALTDHQAYFYPAAQGYLNDSATTEFEVRYGIAVFVRNTLPIICERVGFVYGSYRHEAFGTPPLPRNAHCVRLWRHDNNMPLVVAHMHGIWQPHGKADSPERISQAIVLANLIEDVREPQDDLVVCGDFNVLPGSATFDILARNLGVTDLVVANGYTDTRSSYYKKTPRYADYMLVSPNVQVRSFQVADVEVSDHLPLILDIE